MCKAIEDMIEQAYEEGRIIMTMQILKRMLNAGKYDLKDIAVLSGMSVEELEKLKAGKTA